LTTRRPTSSGDRTDPLTADPAEPTEHDYLLTVGCSCGVTVMRWITEAEAVSDLMWSCCS